MIKENKLTLIITSILILLPIAVGIFLWDKLPDTMATHFGVDNEANGYMSKHLAIIGLPLIMLAIQWVCAIVMAKDPKSQNLSNKLYKLVLWIIPIISLIAIAFTYAYNLGVKLNITYIMCLLLGVMFTIIGNYLPKMRQNYTMGIKIPWTLANEENWNKTHRLAGVLWIMFGLATIVGTLMGLINSPLYVTVMGIALTIVVLIPCVYSFYLHSSKGM